MGIIIELSQHVANQIAAGEVVERPSSVVKEMMENALDAGATSIEIRIKNGGFDYIVIQDDGQGMDEADLRLCLKRYATSKLTAVSDLERLHTFGFRGEALPSIAAISRMSILSRQRHESFGLKMVVEGSVVKEIVKASCGFGTRIEVRDLFYNVPARLKFARSKRVETAEIERLIKAFAFIHHEISFSFFSDDKMVFSCGHDPAETMQDRGVLLLGPESTGHLYNFGAHTEVLEIQGVLGAPVISRRDSRGITTFVNNRLVVDRKLIMAIRTAFQTVMEVGYQPVCAINIKIAPDELDVNIHPRKTEVRFRDERRVIAHLISTISDFLAKTPWLAAMPSASYFQHHQQSARDIDALLSPLDLPLSSMREQAPYGFFMPQPTASQKPLLIAKRFCDLKVIGQVMATYLVLESEDGLVLLDQHAAHERIMFERIKKQQGAQSITQLLIPVSMQFSSSEMALIAEHHADFHALGIELDMFGDNVVVIRSVPDYVRNSSLHDLMKDMLADLVNYGRAYAQNSIFDHVCATLACHASIRAGQVLRKEEIEALLVSLDDTDFGAHCPHGRPIVKSFKKLEVKTWFDRT